MPSVRLVLHVDPKQVVNDLSSAELLKFIADLVVEADGYGDIAARLILWLDRTQVSLEEAKKQKADYEATFQGEGLRFETWGDG